MIAIIDYGRGNLYSVQKAFARLGAQAVVTSDAGQIAAADKVVLPGVGAFGDCMNNLRSYGLETVIRQVTERGTPFLGICLGLQLLFDGSEEDPGVAGLGIIPGMVRKIETKGLKIPHMGWNNLAYKAASPLLTDLPDNPYVYFVHSFHAVPADEQVITAVTAYGQEVTAAVGRANVQAVQFHPEKSSAVGMQMLKNWLGQ
ncbi:imidazole glycerol phosphate synthase subunit HisH [Anaerospora hongkongensis]|uniref:imidazole glycerol phosphate synthase subunit HisH n=1 Tax=Anaerospora hongkongensis TaxID=244830 RepID=UPI0028A25DF2|nr:imidazole glycerol phosphate synthase subunit HisH [Anaerospora hongkongensis]